MPLLTSTCPATGAVLWQGAAATAADVERAVSTARKRFPAWGDTPLASRQAIARTYAQRLGQSADLLAETIARETGKPLWEAAQEVQSMIGKVEISIRAQAERAGERSEETGFGEAHLRHRPHGVMAVLGPYNFPGHLPNGHIVPALLAGNCVVFKPSEETPLTGEVMGRLWAEAGLPEGVLAIVQGARETGAALIEADIDGLLFTGSAATGAVLRRALVDRPHVLLALELGGNNPIIAWNCDPMAGASIIVASAFATSGQRCSCARRLIVPDDSQGDRIVEAVVAMAGALTIGAWNAEPRPSLGSLVSAAAARRAREAVEQLVALGAKVLKPFEGVDGHADAFVTPCILDVSGLAVPDEEIFAPVLQVCRVADFDGAIRAANATGYGLAAGLVSSDPELWARYRARARAGVLNWNRPTTGASGGMPFGGLGLSGNHHPSAYYAADYCAYPVASFEAADARDISAEIVGLKR